MFTQRGSIAIPPGGRPGFDHADVYTSPARVPRLYVAHTGAADRVDVIDCARRMYTGALSGLPGVAGVLVNDEQHLLLTTDRGCGRVSVFDAADESLLGRVAVGARPNGIAYDHVRRRAFAFNLGEPIGENCSASVISLDEMAVIATIALPGRPRWAVFDTQTDCVYVNIRQPARITCISAGRLEITGAFDVPATGPHGLALVGERLFCAADSGELVAMNRETGAVEGTVPLSGEPDVIMVDEQKRLLFVAVGMPGLVDIIDQASMTKVETITTARGAHTIAWEPESRSLYAFVPEPCAALLFSDK